MTSNEKNVKVKIFAVLVRGEDDEVERDNVRIACEGVMRLEDGRVEIVYEETLGEEGTAINTLSFSVEEPNVVTLARDGAASCVMTFSENCRYRGTYHMGYLSFDFTVATRRVENSVRFDKGGVLILDYNTEMQGVSIQNSKFRFTITA
ncbi:MAG: DUF1934 domain-containing protein [Clostridia bacterium]|nr:DUF1934 domain-containing protein [Clostridia bacterium]